MPLLAARSWLVCALIVLTGHVAAAEVMTWTVDGTRRDAIVFAPKTATSEKTPLVFSFHGHGDDMENFQFVALERAWPDAIVVYVQGLLSRDGLRGWQVERGEYNDRDLKMVDAVLASLQRKFRVDDDRVYATGFSNGAMFTYLLWAERPRVFAAFAPVAGRLRPSVQPVDPRPLLHIAGERDAQVRFADQKDAIATAVRVNAAAGKTSSCGNGCTVYGSATSAPVVAWIHPGGHEYPPGTSGRIASFFHEHPRISKP